MRRRGLELPDLFDWLRDPQVVSLTSKGSDRWPQELMLVDLRAREPHTLSEHQPIP